MGIKAVIHDALFRATGRVQHHGQRELRHENSQACPSPVIQQCFTENSTYSIYMVNWVFFEIKSLKTARMCFTLKYWLSRAELSYLFEIICYQKNRKFSSEIQFTSIFSNFSRYFMISSKQYWNFMFLINKFQNN